MNDRGELGIVAIIMALLMCLAIAYVIIKEKDRERIEVIKAQITEKQK